MYLCGPRAEGLVFRAQHLGVPQGQRLREGSANQKPQRHHANKMCPHPVGHRLLPPRGSLVNCVGSADGCKPGNDRKSQQQPSGPCALEPIWFCQGKALVGLGSEPRVLDEASRAVLADCVPAHQKASKSTVMVLPKSHAFIPR